MPLRTRLIPLMGTRIEISIYHTQPDPVLDKVEALLQLYHDRFSANHDWSELMALNHQAGQAPVELASDLYELITIGKHHSLAQDSFLNIAIGPLVKAWRIGFSDAHIPDNPTIEQALALSDPHDIQLLPDTKSVYLKKPGMEIDLGALAKGYIADKIIAWLKAMQVPSGFINLGGNVLTFGPAYHNLDHLWRVGIQDPTKPRGHHLAVLAIRDQSVVTSGIYERKLTDKDQSYHHILDPRTGFPISNELSSLTIISKRSLDGEIWSSRFFGQDPNTIMTNLSNRQLGGIAITKDHQLLANPYAQSLIQPSSD